MSNCITQSSHGSLDAVGEFYAEPVNELTNPIAKPSREGNSGRLKRFGGCFGRFQAVTNGVTGLIGRNRKIEQSDDLSKTLSPDRLVVKKNHIVSQIFIVVLKIVFRDDAVACVLQDQ